ncbi:hypothetical protein IE81DRAFT_169367 [Ceraceosorus guamensis]|uniref:Uncharacterized protein n=1 Tax=Ceraceosorus guamensis TaxID=1522189 RepID=A0A316VZC5_9BASI|nr:hypothetical protein IE81DRAFT_169367 [Ceraceosorus guamensis]PWN41621.1 hypothetical protein IE81DRAFT_169367 [Ceraceosorus guamensis]
MAHTWRPGVPSPLALQRTNITSHHRDVRCVSARRIPLIDEPVAALHHVQLASRRSEACVFAGTHPKSFSLLARIQGFTSQGSLSRHGGSNSVTVQGARQQRTEAADSARACGSSSIAITFHKAAAPPMTSAFSQFPYHRQAVTTPGLRHEEDTPHSARQRRHTASISDPSRVCSFRAAHTLRCPFGATYLCIASP